MKTALTLLFIGNSLTAANDLPALVRAMGKAAGIEIRCTTIARPNYSLEDHWNDSDARKAIARGGWSHVVLQQGPSALPESRVLLDEYVRRFDAEIRRAHARTAIFMVWPSAARSADFDGVSRSYTGAAALVDGLLFRAGDAWRAAWRRDAGLALYGPDGFHPSPLGSTLAALAIFHRLTGTFPRGAAGVSARDYEILRAAVAEVDPGDQRSDGAQQGIDSAAVDAREQSRNVPHADIGVALPAAAGRFTAGAAADARRGDRAPAGERSRRRRADPRGSHRTRARQRAGVA